MTTTILLVRHAAHAHIGNILSGRMPGLALTSAGRVQACALAQWLRATRITALYTSPVQRARETAAIIGQAQGLPVLEAAALDEIDFGDWSGQSFDALNADPQWRHWNVARDRAQAPGGETMVAAQARAVGFIAAAACDHDGGTLALVTHCDIIRAAIAWYLGLGLDRLLGFDIDLASVSGVVFDGAIRVSQLNAGPDAPVAALPVPE